MLIIVFVHFTLDNVKISHDDEKNREWKLPPSARVVRSIYCLTFSEYGCPVVVDKNIIVINSLS